MVRIRFPPAESPSLVPPHTQMQDLSTGRGATATGALWITGWNSGDLFRYDSKAQTWSRWRRRAIGPQPYAVYVDETDVVWVSDWGANVILRFDPRPRNSNVISQDLISPGG